MLCADLSADDKARAIVLQPELRKLVQKLLLQVLHIQVTLQRSPSSGLLSWDILLISLAPSKSAACSLSLVVSLACTAHSRFLSYPSPWCYAGGVEAVPAGQPSGLARAGRLPWSSCSITRTSCAPLYRLLWTAVI